MSGHQDGLLGVLAAHLPHTAPQSLAQDSRPPRDESLWRFRLGIQAACSRSSLLPLQTHQCEVGRDEYPD